MKYLLLSCYLLIAGCSAKMVVVTPQIPLPGQPEIISCVEYLEMIENAEVISMNMVLDLSECQRDIAEAWGDNSTILRQLINRHNARENN